MNKPSHFHSFLTISLRILWSSDTCMPLTLLYAVIIANGCASLVAIMKGSKYISRKARSVMMVLTAMRSCS